MRRLNGVDALMLYLDGGSAYNHTLKISVLDPSTDPDGWSWPKARQMFEERAHLLPVFRLRYLPTPLGLHHPIWVEDPEFDLDAHVRRVVCPAPGGMAEFCALVEQIYAHPLDRDRPLWQTWVVEGLDGGRVALVTLLHHAYSDGVGVLDMLAAFYNDTPDEAPVVAPPWEPPPLPSTRQRLGWALRDLPSRLGKIAPTVRAVRDRVRIEREFAKDGDRRVPPTFDRSAPPGPFQRGLSRSRRFSCESFPLAEVREVSKTLGVTINDVFLACVAMWECYIIDGIERGRIAILLKVHHALIDGEGGLRAMRNFLSDSPDDTTLAGPWMSAQGADRPRRTPATVSRRAQLQGQLQGMIKGLTKLPSGLFGVSADAADLGAQALSLKARKASLPFTARRTLFNNTAKSAARAYGNVELPLADVKALAKATGTSVNDVVMTVIDDALHHYLAEHQASTDRPLVAFMPMSLREKSGEGGGNRVSAELVPMGAPKASPVERLKEINAATTRAKDKGRGMQTTSRQAYALLLLGSLTVADALPLLGKLPSANVVISNMKGPTEQLYLAGAPLVAFSGLPIVPPGAGLNVTFASINTALCIAIGAAPEAVHEPSRLAELMQRAFTELQTEAGTTSPTTSKSRTP